MTTPRKLALLGCFLAALAAVRAADPTPPDRAAWMPQAKWGVMNHYLFDWIHRTTNVEMTVDRWNDLVDHFDVEALAEQLKSVGAGWYQISIGQNSGYYLSPNAAYDRITGISPSKCSRRDLVADLYEALHKRGIHLMVYLPSEGPGGDRVALSKLGFERGPHRNAEGQRHWEEVIREWAVRWGPKVEGWWFDGCYWPNIMYRQPEEPNFHSFAAAARAGNPARVVAFNPGVVYRTISITPEEDFMAGEIDKPDLWTPKRNENGKVDGAQVHVLSFLGEKWGMGSPRFTDEQIVKYTKQVADAGGAITWDVPVQVGGTMAPAFMDQLRVVARTLGTLPKS